MEENENVKVVLDLDLESAQESFQSFLEGMESLEDAVRDVAVAFRKAFASLQTTLQKTVTGVDSVTAALSEATAAMGSLMDQMASEQIADQWLGGISAAIDAIALGMDIAKISDKIAPALGTITTSVREWADKSFLPLIKTVFSGETWSNVCNTMGAILSSVMGSIGGVTAKLKESVMAWGAQTAAKKADGEVDKNFIASAIEYVKQFGAMITQLAANTAAWVANTAAKVASTAAEWAHIAAVTVWNGICATATAVTSAFGAAMSVLTSPITLVVGAVAALIAIVVLLVKNWDTVKEVAVNTWNAIVSAFGKAGAWFKSAVLDPLANGFKGAVNGVIGFLNGLIAGVVKGINGLINLLNKLSFAVPDWVPGMGGKTFGFNLKPLTAPQIPYLAKGAVLPANRPFLAMVGDQRHGTNIEAPLATIQEAMAITMEDFVASNMAGHEATVGVLKEILEAVLGIHIGDADIGKAVQRYQQKMAVVYGRPY